MEDKMYLASCGHYSDYYVVGVFSTIDKAIEGIKEYDEDSFVNCDWNIDCVYLDEIRN